MRKPVIGMIGGFRSEDAQKPEGYQRLNVSNAYVVSVLRAGGIPIVLPLMESQKVIEATVGIIDGLLVTGGADVNPLLYGEEPTPKQGYFCSFRDQTDLFSIRSAAECHKPILGICRGLQIMNVAFGGTLYQDVSDAGGVAQKHFQESQPYSASHTVMIEKKSRLYQLLGDTIQANSFHHQAAKSIAPGFWVGAKAKDGIVEEIEKESEDFVVGIQWHPEMMAAHGDKTMQSIFNLFVNTCARV